MSIKVVELFAGVGGFRLGLENASGQFECIWANQWEPSTKIQHAFNCYVKNFGENPNHINEDIAKVKYNIPEHDLLVGGFPCQDYSVARSLSNEMGIQGKKGVLWWEINDIVSSKRPKFILLENVDRLLKSPSTARGRDFGLMLYSLYKNGYSVEWRVINAADYGHPQQRRRVFIFATHNTTNYFKNLPSNLEDDFLLNNSIFSNQFKATLSDKEKPNQFDISQFKDFIDLQENFKHRFLDSGIMINGKGISIRVNAVNEKPTTLKNILITNPSDQLFLTEQQEEKMMYLKGYKRIERTKPNGETYFYSEGEMQYPDNLDKPGRTMLTSEKSINRSTHVIYDEKHQKNRFLSPIEAERLNEFPDNWTNSGMPDSKRYFCMGNALVVGIITKIGKEILRIFENEDQ